MNKRIYNYCIHLLSRQDYSEFKLRQKLSTKKDNLPHEIDEVIEKLKEHQLLQEKRYKSFFIRRWMLRGESEEKIRQRGRREKLDFETEEFKEASKYLGLSHEDNINKLLDKKLRSKEIPQDKESLYKLKNKILRYLLSKGHPYEVAKRQLDDYLRFPHKEF